jgi:hypothetical protein
MMVPACDDMPIYEYKGFDQDFNFNFSIQLLLLGFIIFPLDRT